MVAPALFSSATDEWETPRAFFDLLDAEFHFDLDVCATRENAKTRDYFTIDDDGLMHDWLRVNWMNPPYSDIAAWMDKAFVESQSGSTTVCLVPARTDTAWWHRTAMHAAEIRFVKGRLTFGGAKNPAPFPSALVVFRPGHQGPPTVSSQSRERAS